MTTHRDVARLCAALYDEPGAPSVSWLYRTSPKDAPIYCGIVRVDDLFFVVSRGSFTFQDWLRDLMALAFVRLKHPTWGPIHPGFYEGIDETWAIIRRYLKGRDRVVYAGHSKGAGNSQLLTARQVDDGTLPLLTLCWGEPASGFQPLATYLVDVPCVTYQNGDDHQVDRVTTVPFSFPPEDYVHRSPFTHICQPPEHTQLQALNLFAWHHFTLYEPATPETPIGVSK